MMQKRTTSSWGRFTAPGENEASRFRECSSRKRAFSPRGKFIPLNDKAVGKENVPMEDQRVDFKEMDMEIELFL